MDKDPKDKTKSRVTSKKKRPTAKESSAKRKNGKSKVSASKAASNTTPADEQEQPTGKTGQAPSKSEQKTSKSKISGSNDKPESSEEPTNKEASVENGKERKGIDSGDKNHDEKSTNKEQAVQADDETELDKQFEDLARAVDTESDEELVKQLRESKDPIFRDFSVPRTPDMGLEPSLGDVEPEQFVKPVTDTPRPRAAVALLAALFFSLAWLAAILGTVLATFEINNLSMPGLASEFGRQGLTLFMLILLLPLPVIWISVVMMFRVRLLAWEAERMSNVSIEIAENTSLLQRYVNGANASTNGGGLSDEQFSALAHRIEVAVARAQPLEKLAKVKQTLTLTDKEREALQKMIGEETSKAVGEAAHRIIGEEVNAVLIEERAQMAQAVQAAAEHIAQMRPTYAFPPLAEGEEQEKQPAYEFGSLRKQMHKLRGAATLHNLSLVKELSGQHKASSAEMPPPLDWDKLVIAARFPENDEDKETFAALYEMLADEMAASMLENAEDMLAVYAGESMFMERYTAMIASTARWRDYAQGLRGPKLRILGGVDNPEAIRKTQVLLRNNKKFRDSAEKFVSSYDAILKRLFKEADGKYARLLADTRTGRAFMLTARALEHFG